MKKHIQTIKKIVLTTCCSFTLVIMVNVCLGSEAFAMRIGSDELKQTFIICVITSAVVHCVLRINFASEWMYHTVAFSSEFLSVFGVGSFVLKLIPFTAEVVIGVSIMLLFVHLFCFTMIYCSQKITADEINECLHKQGGRKEDRHGKDN